MKKHLIYLFASAVLFAAGCAKEPAEKGFGRLNVVCATDDGIEIAPQSRAAEQVTPDQLHLNIKGGDAYDRSWQTVAAFHIENPLIKEGNYTATVSYGDPKIERAENPCYLGATTFSIVALETNQVEIVAKAINAQVIVCATEQFMSYFNDIHFTLTTGSGNQFAFDLDAEGYKEAPIFVQAATSLVVHGSARRQSQNGSAEGPQVTFDEQTIASTTAATRYTFKFDAQQAGAATLTILFDDEVVEQHPFDFELNDDATLTPIP